MTETEQALSWDPAVSDDTHQGGHEEGDDALHGVEVTDPFGESCCS